MPYFSGLKILIRNDRRMTHPPERDILLFTNYFQHQFPLSPVNNGKRKLLLMMVEGKRSPPAVPSYT